MKKVESIKCKVERKDMHNLSIFNFQFSICSGFTLVEMLVSIALFMVVAVIAVAALLKIVDADNKSHTLQSTVNNINFAMDSITREIRVGGDYNLYTSSSESYDGSGVSLPGSSNYNTCNSTGCTNGNYTSIVFLSSNTSPNGVGGPCNLTYAYYFEPVTTGSQMTWTIEKAQQNSNGNCKDFLGVNDQYSAIIDPNIIITAYTIKVNNPSANDSNVQPSVFLYFSGYTGNSDNTKTYFDIQTTISERD